MTRVQCYAKLNLTRPYIVLCFVHCCSQAIYLASYECRSGRSVQGIEDNFEITFPRFPPLPYLLGGFHHKYLSFDILCEPNSVQEINNNWLRLTLALANQVLLFNGKRY
jgi:hypothetical protein